MIRFLCECGKQLQAREENAGKVVACPACNRRLTVPDAPPSPTSVQPEEPSARPSAEPRVQEGRAAPPDEEELAVEEEMEDRPRPIAGSSGKATVSLVLGILSMFCNVLAGVPAVILGILALRDIGRSRGRLGGHGLAVAGIVSACVGSLLSCAMLFPALFFAVQRVREAAARAQSQSNLKIMGLAMHNYNDTYQCLPSSGVGDPNKPFVAEKPLLSWRVAILPFIEQQHLYRQFKLDEPWNSPHNIKLLPQMPKIYNCPAVSTPPGETVYQVFIGNGAAFEKSRGLRIPHDFPDGISNTILVVEAARSVPWTKPEDLPFDPQKPIRPLLGSPYRGNSFLVLLADGSIRLVTSGTSENTLKAAITRNGNDRLGPDW